MTSESEKAAPIELAKPEATYLGKWLFKPADIAAERERWAKECVEWLIANKKEGKK